MRAEFLSGLIGKAWMANGDGPQAYDCWNLAALIERTLFNRMLPQITMPDDATWAWMISTFDSHPERRNWIEVPCDVMGLVKAGDGSLVLMARLDRPAHIGVWLRPERGIIHADQGNGVMLEPLSSLKAKGWRKLRFFERTISDPE